MGICQYKKNIMDVIKYLIDVKTITRLNYDKMVLALCLCLEATIYDNLGLNIENEIINFNKMSYYCVDASNIYGCIIKLMLLHVNDIFISDRFKF